MFAYKKKWDILVVLLQMMFTCIRNAAYDITFSKNSR